MATALATGLVVGSIYALIALGYTITHIAAGVLNFAYPNFIILGAFIAYWLGGEHAVAYVAVLIVAMAIAGAAGLVEEVTSIRPVVGAGSHAELVTTVGVATVLTGIMLLIWGSDPLRVPSPFPSGTSTVLGARVQVVDLVLVVVAVAATALLYLVTTRTRYGLAALAQSEDREAARLKGVNVRMLSLTAFVVAAAFAGLVGPLVGIKTFAVATTALVLGIKGFVAMTLGGVGSFPGALVGGLLVGLAEALIARYVGADYQVIGIFVIFIVVVMIRPQGIFGTAVTRAV
jgi:branched-chain amino acid transport system permease protein